MTSNCPSCGNQLEFIQQNTQWYCHSCQSYQQPVQAPPQDQYGQYQQPQQQEQYPPPPPQDQYGQYQQPQQQEQYPPPPPQDQYGQYQQPPQQEQYQPPPPQDQFGQSQQSVQQDQYPPRNPPAPEKNSTVTIIIVFALVVIIILAAVGYNFMMDKEGSGVATITSVSSTSTTPLTPLTLATTGIASDDPLSVTFSNSAGFLFTDTPIRVETNGTVIVAVPLYVSPSTNNVTNGTVSLVLSQGDEVSAPVTINIQNLPTLDTYGMQVGEVSHAFLNYRAQLLGRRIGQLQAASILFDIDTSELQSALNASLTAVLLAQSDVDTIMLNTSTVTTYGTLPNGALIQWDQNSQDIMDRIIAGYLLKLFEIVTPSITKVTARGPLPSASCKVTTRGIAANFKQIISVIEDSRELPNFVRDLQKSNSGLDYALAVAKAGASLIPDTEKVFGQYMMGKSLGAALSIYSIGRAGVDVALDLETLLASEDNSPIYRENLQKSCKALLDTSVSTLTLGYFEAVDEGTSGSFPFFGFRLAFSDLEMLKTLTGIEKETTTYAAFEFPDSYSSSQGFAQITGTAPPRSSIDIGPFGADALGIQGIVDCNGNYQMWVPTGAADTEYDSLTISTGDYVSGDTYGSEVVDLSDLDTSQPVQVPPMISSMTFSGTWVMMGTATQSFPNTLPDPYIITYTSEPSTVELVLDTNPLWVGPISGTFYFSSFTVTITSPSAAVTAEDGHVNIIDANTDTVPFPSYSCPFIGQSDGTTITIGTANWLSIYPGLPQSFTGTVISEPVTGIVRFSCQYIATGLYEGSEVVETQTFTLTH